VTGDARAGAARFLRDDVGPAVVPWAVARVLVLASLALARYVFDHFGTGPRPYPLRAGLFAWDATFYRDIAEHGYHAVGEAGLRFFPLFPLAGRALGPVFLGHEEIALLVIANASALAFAGLLHHLVVRETGDRALARRSVWWGALLPPLLVLALGYAEGLFLVLTVGVFLALRSERWEWAAGLGVLAGLCRPVGVLLALPAVIEVARGWRGASLATRLRGALAVVGAPIGTAIYLLWTWRTRDDLMLPFRVQQDPGLRGGVRDPVSSLVRAAEKLADGDQIGSGLHLLWAVIFLALLVVIARRLPASYTVFAAGSLLLFLSGSNLDSFERYAAATFPLVIGAAIVTARREVETAALALAGGAMVGYGVLVFLGSSVP
jgi:hypothetical protein